MIERTYWNGQETPARPVWVVVADTPDRFPLAWWKPYVGTRRAAVEVVYGDQVFYLDDEGLPDAGEGGAAGMGWRKVTAGRGTFRYFHRNVYPVEGSVEPRDRSVPTFGVELGGSG